VLDGAPVEVVEWNHDLAELSRPVGS
jgi:hypothetical protein